MAKPIVEIKGLKNQLGGLWVHKDINLSLYPNEIAAIIGGSGTGKTTILRSLLTLLKPTDGELKIFGEDIWQASGEVLQSIRRRMGMLFQHNALFSGLTVLENVMFPLKKYTSLPIQFIESLALFKLLIVGLKSEDAHKYPSELSGGMQKRLAAARALALDPELLLLDEPVSGLDPHGVRAFDELLLFLREQLSLTILMVSHDLSSLNRIADKVFFIGEGRVIVSGSLREVMSYQHPLVEDYFHLHRKSDKKL